MRKQSEFNIKNNKHFLFIIVLSFLGAYLFSFIFYDGFDLLNARMNDLFFKIRYGLSGKEEISPYLTHVVINDSTYEEYNEDLKDLKIYGEMIKLLNGAGTRGIACDLFFKETSENDLPLIEAVREAENIYFPVIFYPPRKAARENNMEKEAIHALIEKELWKGDSTNIKKFSELSRLDMVFYNLAVESKGLGHINSFPDGDGINRRFPLVYPYKNGYMPSLSLRAVCDFLKISGENIEIVPGRYILLKKASRKGDSTRDITIPIDSEGKVIINFAGPWEDSFLQFPVQNILKADKNPLLLNRLYDEFEDTLVLISDISTRHKDFGTGPMDKIYPLSGIHLNIANMILTENFIAPSNPLAVLLIAVCGILLLYMGVVMLRPGLFYLAAILEYMLFLLVNLFIFMQASQLVSIFPFSLGLIFSLFAITVYRFVCEKEKNFRIKTANTLEKKFFQNITHDFKTPLTLIHGPLELLLSRLKHISPDLLKNQLSIMKRNSEKLLNLTDEILDFSKIESDTLELRAEKLDICQITKEFLKPFMQPLKKKNITLLFNKVKKELFFFADKKKYKKILRDLMENAIKFSPHNCKLILSVGQGKYKSNGKKYITLTLKDQGLRTQKTNLPNIFKGFNLSASENIRETPPGLLLVKKYMELHKGKFEITHKKGVKLKLYFPPGSTHLAPRQIMKKLKEADTGNDDFAKNIDKIRLQLIKRNILIVGTDMDTRGFIKETLKYDYTVTEASNGRDGIIYADEADIILCDSVLADMDGFEFVKLLRKSKHTRGVPILMLTDRTDIAPVETSFHPDSYLLKPFHHAELLQTINNLLNLTTYNKPFNHKKETTSKNPDSPLLIIDEDMESLASYKNLMEKNGISHFILCSDRTEAMEILKRNSVQTVIMDLYMSCDSNEDLLSDIKTGFPGIPVIICTGYNDNALIIEAMKKGAFDYIEKPVRKEKLITVINSALETFEGGLTFNKSRKHALKFPEAFSNIITGNEEMLTLFREMELFAESREPILITGENGSGKELIAKTIHKLSEWTQEFVPVNIAGIDDVMFSDMLFGHKKGAFTGAVAHKQGLIKKAQQGSLFLDEIGDLKPEGQIKLLRLLQEHTFYPLGADKEEQSSARIILATNKNLKKLVKQGKFREDLFFRITHKIKLPPLRDRLDDLPLLLNHFFQKTSTALKRKTPVFPAQLLPLLKTYHFPGNIRELEMMIKNAVSLHTSRMLSLSYFTKYINSHKPDKQEIDDNEAAAPFNISFSGDFPQLKDVELHLITRALEKAEGNQTLAAKLLGMSPSTLNRRINRG